MGDLGATLWPQVTGCLPRSPETERCGWCWKSTDLGAPVPPCLVLSLPLGTPILPCQPPCPTGCGVAWSQATQGPAVRSAEASAPARVTPASPAAPAWAAGHWGRHFMGTSADTHSNPQRPPTPAQDQPLTLPGLQVVDLRMVSPGLSPARVRVCAPPGRCPGHAGPAVLPFSLPLGGSVGV